MKVRFLLDENVPLLLKRALLRREPRIDILRIGDAQSPPLGIPDPELLLFLEQSKRLLITLNRASMPAHLYSHYAAGRHTWGVLWVRKCRYQQHLRQTRGHERVAGFPHRSFPRIAL